MYENRGPIFWTKIYDLFFGVKYMTSFLESNRGPLLELNKGPLLELNKGPLLELDKGPLFGSR